MPAGYLDIEVITPRLNGKGGSDRAFIAGRSGSGKSYLARQMLTVYRKDAPDPLFRGFLVVIDPNHNFEFPANLLAVNPDEIKIGKQNPVILYRPHPRNNNAEAWNKVWEILFRSPERVMTYVDETYAMEPLFNIRRLEEGVNYLNAYLTQGRAKGKGAIFAAQRPVSIPRNIIAQAEWDYMFDLPLQDDRKTMADVMGDRSDEGRRLIDRNALGRYEFFHINPNLREPMRFILPPNQANAVSLKGNLPPIERRELVGAR